MRGGLLQHLLHMYQLYVAGGDGGTENAWTFCGSINVRRRIDFLLHTRNVDDSHSGPSDQLDLGSDHRSVCPHCKLAEVPCNRRSKRRVKHKWLSKEYVPKYQATIAKGLRFSTRQASTTSSPLLFNAPMLRPRSHQHIIQPHFQRLLDFRRRCRDKRERCRLSKLIRSGLRRAMRRRRNAQLNEVLLEFRDLNRLESIRHDPLNNMNRSHEHDPQPDGFAEYLARIFAMDEADLPRRNPSQHILNIPPLTKSELQVALRRLRKHTSADPPGVELEMW